MRVNVYAEEMTDKVEIITKTIEGEEFTAVRFYLELPVTTSEGQVRGPFMHRIGDDDSSAVTFWGKKDLRKVLQKAIDRLDEHYGHIAPEPSLSKAMEAIGMLTTLKPDMILKPDDPIAMAQEIVAHVGWVKDELQERVFDLQSDITALLKDPKARLVTTINSANEHE